jgi:hypothetical protein
MIRSFSAAFAAVLTFGLAATSFAAPAVTNVSPAEGSVGTQFTITGTELGTKPPRAVLKLHGDASAKTIPLKLTKPFDGTTINATVLKIQPGVYDLIVTPNHGSPITVDSAFTGQAPAIDSLSATTIAPGDHVDILGRFFGSKRGKVTIGDVTAKVTYWDNGKITVVVSKKNKSGTATFDIFGKGGSQNDGASATVVAPIAGKDYLKVDFDNGGPDMVCHDIANSTNVAKAIDGLAQSHLIGNKLFGSGLGSNTHIFDIAVGGPLTQGAVYTGSDVFVLFNQVGISPASTATYDNQGITTWTVTIAQRAGNRISGSYSGTLNKTTGAGPSTYTVSGDFTLTVR